MIQVFFPLMGNATSFLRKVEFLLHKKEEFTLKGTNTFVPLNKGIMLEFTHFPFDVYFVVNKDKKIKMYHKGDELEREKIERIIDSEGQLVLKYADFIEFVSKIEDKLNDQYKEIDVELVYHLIHDSASDFISKVGLTEESVELANKSIKSVVDQISKNNDLLNIIFHEFNRKSYKNDHSMMIPFLATAMCDASAYSSQQNL